jgi:hypothetical protein
LPICDGTIYGLGWQLSGHAWVRWGSFLGLAALIVLVIGAAQARLSERMACWRDVAPTALFFYFWIVLGIALLLTSVLIPRTYDRYLYAFDGSLGFQPSFLLGELARANPVPLRVLSFIYHAVSLPIALLWATQRRNGYSLGWHVFPLAAAASTGGYLFYYVFPATGPIFEFGAQFPHVLPPVSIEPGAVLPMMERAVRNGMPSLHFGSILLLWWNCRVWPGWARFAAGVFLAGTAFATLALGQQYLIDLVVAVPVMLAFHAAAIHAVPLRSSARWQPIAAGCALTAGWLVLLRFGAGLWLGRPGLSWMLIAVTVSLCFALERRLWRVATEKNGAESQALRPVKAQPGLPFATPRSAPAFPPSRPEPACAVRGGASVHTRPQPEVAEPRRQ